MAAAEIERGVEAEPDLGAADAGAEEEAMEDEDATHVAGARGTESEPEGSGDRSGRDEEAKVGAAAAAVALGWLGDSAGVCGVAATSCQ